MRGTTTYNAATLVVNDISGVDYDAQLAAAPNAVDNRPASEAPAATELQKRLSSMLGRGFRIRTGRISGPAIRLIDRRPGLCAEQYETLFPTVMATQFYPAQLRRLGSMLPSIFWKRLPPASRSPHSIGRLRPLPFVELTDGTV